MGRALQQSRIGAARREAIFLFGGHSQHAFCGSYLGRTVTQRRNRAFVRDFHGESVVRQPRRHGRTVPQHEAKIEPKPLARVPEQFHQIFQTMVRTTH